MSILRSEFEALVRQHHAAVFRAAHRIVRSPSDAEDVAQQVFLRVWRGGCHVPAPADEAERVLRWLASRVALSTLRARRRRRRHEEVGGMSTADSVARAAGDESAARDAVRAVQVGLTSLADLERAVLTLRFQEGMTFAAMADVLGCAESTVHARLQAALDALRRRLRDLGLAVGAADLGGLIGAIEVPVAVPASLLPRLLAVPASAVVTGTSVAKLAALALAVLGLGAYAASFAWSDPPRGPIAAALRSASAPVVAAAAAATDTRRPVPGVVADAAASAPGVAVAAPQDPYAAAPRGWIRGTVVTADDGTPLVEARVVAWCRQLSSKAQRFEVAARTDAAGRFELEMPITSASGTDWVPRVELTDWAGTFDVPVVRVAPGAIRSGIDARLSRCADDVVGDWTGTVVVTDGVGRCVADAAVVVVRRVRGADGAPTEVTEFHGKTDELGRVVVHGYHRGPKQLDVRAFGRPFAPTARTLQVDETDAGRIEVVLAPDVPLALRVVDGRSGGPVRGVAVHAERDGHTQAAGASDADGRLVLRGLDGGAVVLTGGGDPWSRFRVNLAAGIETHELRVKRRNDPAPVGLACGELHGRVIDAATGAPLPVAAGAVSTWWLPPDAMQTAADVWAELIDPMPYQTASFGEPPPPAPEFHEEFPAPGRYLLVLRTPGHAVAVLGPFDVGVDTLVDGLEFRAERGVRVVVDVRGPDGAPVADADVWIGAPGVEADSVRAEFAREVRESTRSGAGSWRGRRSSPSGSAVIDHVPTGVALRVHVVDARGRHGASAAFHPTGNDAELRIDVDVR